MLLYKMTLLLLQSGFYLIGPKAFIIRTAVELEMVALIQFEGGKF